MLLPTSLAAAECTQSFLGPNKIVISAAVRTGHGNRGRQDIDYENVRFHMGACARDVVEIFHIPARFVIVTFLRPVDKFRKTTVTFAA
jgi:hypothetical protein